MRTVTKTLMIALCGVLMCGTVSANGTEPRTRVQIDTPEASPKELPFQVGMYRVNNSLTMNVLIEKKLGDKVVIKLVDQKGMVLFEDMLGRRQQKYARKFNFSEIHDGHYSVVISNGEEQIVKEIQLSTLKLYEMPARSLVAVN